jgi:hypothetical protein
MSRNDRRRPARDAAANHPLLFKVPARPAVVEPRGPRQIPFEARRKLVELGLLNRRWLDV